MLATVTSMIFAIVICAEYNIFLLDLRNDSPGRCQRGLQREAHGCGAGILARANGRSHNQGKRSPLVCAEAQDCMRGGC